MREAKVGCGDETSGNPIPSDEAYHGNQPLISRNELGAALPLPQKGAPN